MEVLCPYGPLATSIPASPYAKELVECPSLRVLEPEPSELRNHRRIFLSGKSFYMPHARHCSDTTEAFPASPYPDSGSHFIFSL